MTKLMTVAATLALLLTGCGANPTAAGINHLRSTAAATARPARPATGVSVPDQIVRALQPQFPGAVIQVYNVEASDTGLYRFMGQAQTVNGTMTTLLGHYDALSHEVVLDNAGTDYKGGD